MLKLFICDDEIDTLGYIEEIVIKEFSNIFKICTMSSIRDLNDTVYSGKIIPDIIIIDIHLKDGNGSDAIEKIKSVYPNIKVIYLSGDNTYKRKAIFSSSSFFVSKPLIGENYADLIMVIEEYIKIADNEFDDYVSFSFNRVDYRIKFKDIIYIQSKGRKVYIYTIDGKYEKNIKLGDFCKSLSNLFVRIHERYVVNIEYIKDIDKNYVDLLNLKRLSISKDFYYDCISERFAKFLGDKR